MPGTTPVTDSTDAALLARVGAGDMDAFEALMKRHEDAVWRFARARAAVEQDAEDVVQETFVAAWRHAQSYRAKGSVRGWLLAITRNSLSHYYRRRVDEPARLEPLDEIAIAAGWGSIEPDAERAATRELVAAALARLPTEDREILLLRDVEGFSGEETAQLLELSVAAMKSRLHRARLKLVAALRELSHDES